jgi:50S ribosomal subunit-associated GTPase HflX
MSRSRIQHRCISTQRQKYSNDDKYKKYLETNELNNIIDDYDKSYSLIKFDKDLKTVDETYIENDIKVSVIEDKTNLILNYPFIEW